MANLATRYMGLELKSPLVVSANPLSQKLENIVAMEDAGAGAVVLFSLFEEQIRQETLRAESLEGFAASGSAEGANFLPSVSNYGVGSEKYLDLIRKAKDRVDIPIIASLNGTTAEGWIDHARDIEQSGADGLELNIYYIPADVSLSSVDVESRYLDIVSMVRDAVSIPLAVKMSPYFSSVGNFAARLRIAGAEALVLFNRFYQPDFDIEELEVLPSLELSHPSEIRLPLLWIAVLYGRVPVSLAASTGVGGAREMIKYILAGADAVMCASSLLRHGIPWIKETLREFELYMKDMPFETVEAFRGVMSQQHVADPTSYERNNYLQILEGRRWK